MSFFVTFTSIVYIELLPKWGDNVTKNDTLFFGYFCSFLNCKEIPQKMSCRCLIGLPRDRDNIKVKTVSIHKITKMSKIKPKRFLDNCKTTMKNSSNRLYWPFERP